MSQNKINKYDLLSEIKLLLKDELIAKIDDDSEEITITFLNGQKFNIALNEVW